MGIQESLAKRRTYYNINKELPVAEADVIALVENTTELVPDAFNMKSARVIVATKEKQDALWDAIYDAFGGKVAREKIDSFKAGYGTLLYFYDEDVVKGLQEQFPLYAPNFPIWAQQANGMLQISIWTALRELNSSTTTRSSTRRSRRCSACRTPGSSSPRCRSAALPLSRRRRTRKTSRHASRSSIERNKQISTRKSSAACVSLRSFLFERMPYRVACR